MLEHQSPLISRSAKIREAHLMIVHLWAGFASVIAGAENPSAWTRKGGRVERAGLTNPGKSLPIPNSMPMILNEKQGNQPQSYH